MGVAGFVWGGLSDRYGARIVVLCGTVLLGAGLALASQARTLLQFQLCYGVLVGIAAGSFFAPLIATVSSWFEENRGLAVALVSAGMGVAPLTISPFTAWLITHMDRSEEHTSELQSLMRISYAVLCLIKKNITKSTKHRQ